MLRTGSRRGRTIGLVAALLAAAVFVARTLGTGGAESEVPPEGNLPTYAASEAANHVGEAAVVCGRVAGTAYRPEVAGRPTFLNFERPYPDQTFTVVIWGEHRAKFGRPEVRFREETVCVRGRIRLHRGTPQIEAAWPEQLRIDTVSGRRRRGDPRSSSR